MKFHEPVVKDDYAIYNGDCVELMAQMPDNSIDFSVYSPPFSSLYIYSDSERDMGNASSHSEFFEHYKFAIREKLRLTKPGRLTAIHVKDLVYYSNSSEKGDRGLFDFSGECIRAHIECGWTLHSKVTIWRCPVREMTKSKPDGLLYKNFRTDAARVRQGMPEYLLVFRKWSHGMNETPPVMHDFLRWKEWAGEAERFVTPHNDLIDDFERMRAQGLDMWQQIASPVWMDTSMTDVLNVSQARSDQDEKHLCPMPLDLTDRAVRLWSNAGETVLSPFLGIGSEGYASLRAGRKFMGTELKPEYFAQACKNIEMISAQSAFGDLLD